MNVQKYLPLYIKNASAEFIEGTEFKTIVHYKIQTDVDGLSEGINEGINGGINQTHLQVLRSIRQKKIAQTKDVIKTLQVSVSTAERLIKKLKDNDWITFKGPKKTGRYELTKVGNRLLKSHNFDGINEGLNEGLTSEQAKVLNYIQQGFKTSDLAKSIQMSVSSIERILKTMKENELIIFSGPKRTGTYQLTRKGQIVLNQQKNKND